RGATDPTTALRGDSAWRALRTPDGPATLRIQVRQTLGEVRGAAWGEGAQWALDAMPGLLGALDDASQFDPRTPEVTRAWHQQPHWRFGRTDLLFESLLPSILEQKVTAQEAFSGFRRLVQRFG